MLYGTKLVIGGFVFLCAGVYAILDYFIFRTGFFPDEDARYQIPCAILGGCGMIWLGYRFFLGPALERMRENDERYAEEQRKKWSSQQGPDS